MAAFDIAIDRFLAQRDGPGLGTDVADAAGTTLDHCPCHGLLEEERAFEIRAEDQIEVLLTDGLSQAPARYADIVDQYVDLGRSAAAHLRRQGFGPRSRLLIGDEAVASLDVTIQAQVINLLMDLQRDKGIAILFIGHDMAVVEHIAHRVAVMYLGEIVEIGDRRSVFGNPQHPYTRKPLSAVPVADPA